MANRVSITDHRSPITDTRNLCRFVVTRNGGFGHGGPPPLRKGRRDGRRFATAGDTRVHFRRLAEMGFDPDIDCDPDHEAAGAAGSASRPYLNGTVGRFRRKCSPITDHRHT
jgi:hypothetical protein